MTGTQTAPRTFYSESRGLMITIEPPKRVIEDGMSKVLHGKTVQFSPMGQDKFGYLVTSDPEVIAAMEKQPDVFDEAEFNKRSVPPEKRVELAQEENRRLVEQNNRLLAMLEQQKAAKAETPELKIPVPQPVRK